MHPLVVFIAAFGVVSVQADLTCLGWALISPVVGLFCHFEPNYFQKAENDTVTAVEDAIQNTENLVQFDLTHNPAVVTYNFFEETSKGGLGQGGRYLQNVSKDFGEVTVGFGKETANQLVTVMELSYWNDLSMCLITGAGRLITQEKRRRLGKRAALPSVNDAVSMAQGCVSQKFKQLASPAVFHVNGTNQKIGSTISDLAALLVPIGAEEKAATDTAEALEGAVDLAIPGSESTTRVVKKIGENTADHFANEEEAKAVAENMKDQTWVDENCGVCGVSPPPLGDVIAKRRRGSGDHLDHRGVLMASCCRDPAIRSDEVNVETPDTESEGNEDATYDPKYYKTLSEADLVPAPKFTVRDISVAADVEDLSKDLDTFSTGVVTWSPQLIQGMSSDEVLLTLRKAFTSPNDPMYKALRIRDRDGSLRMSTVNRRWIYDENPILKPLADFATASIAHGIDVVAKLKGLSARSASRLDGEIEFFYTAPNKKALTGIDPRGFHIDSGLMQFGMADVPGLVVKSTVTGTASRVAVEKNAFHLLKARFWDLDAWYKRAPQGPTWHSVFGPEMAKEGRISIIMSIYKKLSLEW